MAAPVVWTLEMSAAVEASLFVLLLLFRDKASAVDTVAAASGHFSSMCSACCGADGALGCPHLESFWTPPGCLSTAWAGLGTLLIKILLSQVWKCLCVRASFFSVYLSTAEFFVFMNSLNSLFLNLFENKSSYGGMISGRVFDIWACCVAFFKDLLFYLWAPGV